MRNCAFCPVRSWPKDNPLFSIVEDGKWWIDANFKETDLARIAPAVPILAAGIALVLGVILLISGNLPSDPDRINVLRGLFPLAFVEVSYLVGSIAGILLILVVRGLNRRLARAWSVTMVLLAVGLVASLTKGLDWKEALSLALALGILGMFRSAFVSKGDPVGDPEAARQLIWRLREMADQTGRRCAFYSVGSAFLPTYLDLGLSILKMGEVARVDLTGFTLEGSSKRDFRQAVNKATREGYAFEILPKIDVQAAFADLKAVSDAWFSARNGAEKGF